MKERGQRWTAGKEDRPHVDGEVAERDGSGGVERSGRLPMSSGLMRLVMDCGRRIV